MKPNWNDAPEWANHLTMEGCGDWYWHELEPTLNEYVDEWDSKGKLALADANVYYCASETLESRP